MKRNIIAVLAIVMVLCCVTLAACNDKNDTNVLDSYIFDMDGTTVTDDFTLPATIGGEAAEWKSEGTAIQLEKRESDWLAKVTLPETGLVDVNLTVTVKKSSKSYTVRVKALDVYDFMNSYVFPKDKATIVDNFDLETEFAYKGKTATIAWSVDEDYELYIKVINNGKTLQVTPQGNQTPVKVKATFTYNGVSASQSYRMTVYKTMEGLELVNYWYTNTGVSIDMSGYVVLIGTAYSSGYKNVTLYMVNDDFTAGYYLFRVKTTDEHAAKLAPGVHITVTGTTNINYNGLVETNAGGKLVVDDDVAPIDVNAHVKAIDQEVIGNLPATVYHESRLVSLTNWKVTKVAADADKQAGANYTLLTLEKGGAKVQVRVSKYMEGAYATKADDATWTAINALTTTYPVGSMVNVTGILSNYKGWQIMPLSASAVTASGQEEDAADTVYAGKKVAAAIAKVNEKLVADGINTAAGKTVRITTQKEFALETAVDGVEISYEIVGKSNAIVLDGGKMTVTPGNPETATILATYKSGEFESVQFLSVESLIPTAASMLDDLKEKLKDPIKAVTDLPTVEGATIEWKVVSGKDSIKIENGQLIPTLKEKDVRTIINATLTYNGVTRNKDYVVVVKAGKGSVEVKAPFEEGKGYVLTVDQTNLAKQIFAVNAMDGYYIKSNDNPEKVELVYVEKVEEGYKLYFKTVNKDKTETKTYIAYKVADGHTNILLDKTGKETNVWKWNAEKECFVCTLTNDGVTSDYYLGANYDNAKFRLNQVKEGKPYFNENNFRAYLGEIKFVPLKEKNVTYSVSNKDSATVKLSADKGLDGQKVTFTVEIAENWRLVKVRVNGEEVTAVNGVYTATIDGATKISVKTTSTIAQPFVPEKATAMQAGTYKFYMDTTAEGGGVLYATGAVDKKGALVTTSDPTKAADFVVEAVAGKENVYTIKFGDKYLVGYLNGTYNNMKLDTTPGEWTWNTQLGTFTCTFKNSKGKDTTFFFGSYYNAGKDSVGNTMALSDISFVTGKNAANIGKTQFVGCACTLKEVTEA